MIILENEKSLLYARITIFALPRISRRTLKACRTQRPAVIAFVVAIAGIMLPAISGQAQSVSSELVITNWTNNTNA